MRQIRTIAAATVAAALAVGPLAGLAGADDGTTGVGTGQVTATALTVALGANGDLLTVKVLADDGASTIDPAKGATASSTTLRPLTISSKTVPALNLTTPAVTTSSSGPEDKKSVEPALPSLPAFAGKINAVLASAVDAAGARSGLSAGLANLKVAGGLVSVPTGVIQTSSKAAGTSASGSRLLEIPEVRVLDLSAVLEGIGLDLTDLSVTQVLGLLKSLGVTLPDIADPAAAVAALNGVIDTLQATAAGPVTAQLCATVDGALKAALGGVGSLVGGAIGSLPQTPVGGLVGSLPNLGGNAGTGGGGIQLPPLLGGGTGIGGLSFQASALPGGFSCSNLLGATVKDLLDTVQASLGKLLAGALVELGDTALLSVKDVKLGLESVATDAVETSVAEVTASIGQVKVGELPVPSVPALDLTAPVAVLNQATAAIQGAIAQVLTPLNASLANLVKVDVLKIDEVVGAAGDYVNAASTVTALKATITPPATPLSAAALDLGGTPVASILNTVTTTVPAIAPLMGQLEAALGGIQALSAPSVVTVGQLSGNASFRPVAAQVVGGEPGAPSGELPRTGGSAALPAMAGVLLAAMAITIRRYVRSIA